MNISVGKAAVYGLCGGTIAGAVIKPKTQSGEHAANKFSTVAGLGTLAATPYLVKSIVTKNPRSTVKIANQAGKTIEKGIEYAAKYGKKALNSDFVQKNCRGLYVKFKNTKIGQKIIDAVNKGIYKISSNKTVQKVVTKATEALKTFAKSSTAKKGAIGLVAAGVALLAYAGIKTITNYYKKEGAIDQKYKDMEVMDNMLA